MVDNEILEKKSAVCELVNDEENISMVFIEILFKANKLTEQQYLYIQKKYCK